MNLLPKTFHDFSSKQYWNTFFCKRGEKAFEWYGEYGDLCGLLHKYIRPKDCILVAGCGNSTLSADLYKVGYRNITNVDNSEVVIRQMQDRYQEECPEMQWLTMDLSSLALSDNDFGCVLDKAALDALMTDDSQSVVSFINKYFSEVGRVLRVGGRYLCVSLLQEHILKHILHWFPSNGWMVRICRCEDAEKSQSDAGNFSFPVFVVVCTKFKQMPNFKPVIEIQLDGDTVQRLEDATQAEQRVMELQQYALLRHTLHSKHMAGEASSVQLCDPATGSVRYTLLVVDTLRKTHTMKFAVFIVPLGREREWLFGSRKGREKLAESAGASRLLVVHLHRGGTHHTLQQVQDELSTKVMELAPSKLPSNTKVPFLSVGEEMGEVVELWRGNSKHSGDYVVEDVRPPEAPALRRLVFLDNQSVVQSEARLKQGKEKRRKKKGGEGGRGGNEKASIDFSYLSCKHHLAMVSGLCLGPPAAPVLLLGLGGGPLATYIHNNFPKVTLTAVDLDPAMVEVAKRWFGFVPNERLKVEVCDGIEYIHTAAKEGVKFGVIMFDVDSKDTTVGMSCPPPAFVRREFLEMVASCLADGGLLIANVVCRDEEILGHVLEDVKFVFPSVLSQQIPEEVNRVLFCSPRPYKDPDTLKRRFEDGVHKMVSDLKCQQKDKEDAFNLKEILECLSVA